MKHRRRAQSHRDAALLSRHRPIEQDLPHAWQHTGEPAHTVLLTGGDHNRAAFRRFLHDARQRRFVVAILGPQTQVDDVRSLLNRLLDSRDKHLAGCGQLAIEHLDAVDVCSRRLLADYGSDRGAVTEAIDVIGIDAPVADDADPAGDTANVRVVGVHAAIDDGHPDSSTHASTPAPRSISNNRANASDRSASSRGGPASTTRAPSSTTT